MSNEEMLALILSKLEMLEQGQNKLEAELKQSKDDIMLDFNTVIENKVSKEIRLIAEQHGDIIARLPDVEEQEALKSRVRVLEHIVTDLRVEMDRLKKAQ